MADIKFLTTWDQTPEKCFAESPKGESLTIPDQTIPLREMVYRYQQGLPIPRINTYDDYTGEDEEVTFADTEIRPDMDISEVEQELRTIKASASKSVAKSKERSTEAESSDSKHSESAQNSESAQSSSASNSPSET